MASHDILSTIWVHVNARDTVVVEVFALLSEETVELFRVFVVNKNYARSCAQYHAKVTQRYARGHYSFLESLSEGLGNVFKPCRLTYHFLLCDDLVFRERLQGLRCLDRDSFGLNQLLLSILEVSLFTVLNHLNRVYIVHLGF